MASVVVEVHQMVMEVDLMEVVVMVLVEVLVEVAPPITTTITITITTVVAAVHLKTTRNLLGVSLPL